ncbi:MAG: TlpA family protein disulfide reductase [Bryobacterales bacterium]|nr:TlpA family protein disulfide reductase [Bryobacterales bacterium]
MRRRDLLSSLVPAGAALWSPHLLHAIDLPRACPDFAVTMPDGKQVKLSSFQGKVIAVEFLLTYCSHCQRASRTSDIVYRELGAKGFQPIGIAIDPAGDPVAYSRNLNLSFPVGKCAQTDAMNFLQLTPSSRMMMPQVCFVDRRFTIREQYSGDNPFFGEMEEKNIRDLVGKLLAEGGAKAPAKTTPAKKKT